MRAVPGTTICVEIGEAASLELGAGIEAEAVRLTPRFGEPAVIPLDGGAFDIPEMAAPNAVRVEWLASGSDEAAPAVFECSVEVVSRHYFPLSQLKGFGMGQDEFDTYDEWKLRLARRAATEVFEQNARRSFVHRIGKTRDYGRDALLQLRHNDVYEVLTEGYVQVSDCQLERTPGGGAFPRFAEYLYGADSVPADVSIAVLELAAYILRPTNRPLGATGESSDAGYIHFTTAGRDGATAIPEVNAAIEQFGRGVQYVW